ncbi:MAG: hypothetical protein AB7V18_00690 [Pyrinomonadaceae bacterium]
MAHTAGREYLFRAALAFIFAAVAALAAHAQGDIRKVDFKNFTYAAFCVGDTAENVTVKDGEFSRETQEDGYVDRFYFRVFDIAYGDLTGDAAPEAVILTVCNTGGTGNFSEGFIYTLQGGKPKLLAHLEGGDRAYGGLRGSRIENGVLTVDSNDVGEMGGACCPEFVVSTKYKLTAGKLVAIGRPLKRPLVPTTRVAFARGTSGKTYNDVAIPAGEAIRYKVNVRGGQRLSVSVSSDQASLRLLEEARITTGINNFLAVLPSNGDYTIEIENTSNSDISITVNIKVN